MKIVPSPFIVPRYPSKRARRFLGVAAIFLAAVSIGNAQEEARTVFNDSIGALPPKAAPTVRALGTPELSGTLEFSVALHMRNFKHLQKRVAKGETIPAEEMESSYLPLPNDYHAVKEWLKAQGFTIVQQDSSRLAIFARGTLEQIEKAFETKMVGVTVEGVNYAAASVAPSLPQSVADPVLGINGLQPFHHLHKQINRRPQATTGITYKINDILTCYDAKNSGVTGAGQTIAILIDTTPATSDLTKFWTANSISQSLSNVTTINVNNKTLPAVSGEETLDVEWTSGIASGAKIRVYATGDLDDTSLDKGLSKIITDVGSDATIHQLSISLGEGETYETSSQFTTDAQYFATLASKGVSTFVSSGDGGSTPDDTGTGNEDAGPLQVEYYSSDPSVTGVGGTTLHVTGSDVRSSETTWSGSGGGVSIQFAKPSWQVGTGVPSGTKRFVPDVAMPADPDTGAYVYLQGSAQTIGGTSWAAPTWAGFCALINQARANAGKTGGIGLLNPSLYPLIGTSNFYDVTSGSNAEGSKAAGKYSATVGYDETTGIGTPDVGVLINTLVGQTATAPTLTGFSPTSGPVGTSVTINGTNFSGVTAMAFNGTAASYTVNSATQIVATVPTGATTGTIKVTTSAGSATSSSAFTVTTATVPAPTISSFSPTSGAVGSSVTITGSNFTNASAVTFNGTGAAYTVNSATQITATVPTGATSGTIKVTTPGGTATSAASFTVTTSPGTGTSVVISQVYGGGGGSTSIYANDYIELFNPTSATVDLNTYSVQYASATGTSWSVTDLSGSIAPGHYYLVAEEAGSVGSALPTPDASGKIAMSASAGKVALAKSQTAITGHASASVVDFVGYGSTANDYEGSGPAPTLSASTADFRAGNGRTDTNNNAADFTAASPNPRDAQSAPASVRAEDELAGEVK